MRSEFNFQPEPFHRSREFNGSPEFNSVPVAQE
jgi:hypothetical protein